LDRLDRPVFPENQDLPGLRAEMDDLGRPDLMDRRETRGTTDSQDRQDHLDLMANMENVDSSGLRARRESLVSREGQGPEDHLEWRVPREILELQDSPETLENRDQVVSRESQAAQAKMAKRVIEASRAIQAHLASLASRAQQGSPVRLDHLVNRVMPGTRHQGGYRPTGAAWPPRCTR